MLKWYNVWCDWFYVRCDFAILDDVNYFLKGWWRNNNGTKGREKGFSIDTLFSLSGDNEQQFTHMKTKMKMWENKIFNCWYNFVFEHWKHVFGGLTMVQSYYFYINVLWNFQISSVEIVKMAPHLIGNNTIKFEHHPYETPFTKLRPIQFKLHPQPPKNPRTRRALSASRP